MFGGSIILSKIHSWLFFPVLQNCGHDNRTVLFISGQCAGPLTTPTFRSFCASLGLTYRLRTPNESFFSNISQNILGDWADLPNMLWGILGSNICPNFVTVHIPSPWFCITQPFFLQKAKILQDFLFGIGIWIWVVENLRISHHASIVRGLTYDYDDSYLVSFLLLFLVKVALITYLAPYNIHALLLSTCTRYHWGFELVFPNFIWNM